MPRPIFIKPQGEVCRDRAAKAADSEYDEKIRLKWEEFKSTKKSAYYTEYTLLKRRKKKFENKMYEYFMENYEHGSDIFENKNEKRTGGFSLKSASDILMSALKEVGG